MMKSIAASTLGLWIAVSATCFAQQPRPFPPPPQSLWKPTGANLKVLPQPASDAAPVHDVSGTWFPARGENSGIGGQGAVDMPEDGKPQHQLPYTDAAREKMRGYRPGNGKYQNVPSMINDPAVIYCDPQGIPRQDLYELRGTQIMQTDLKTVVLYQFSKIWRVIWTDGRDLPKDPDPRWYGYSIGKWADDTTFVVDTIGVDDRTWLDKGGRPHSEDMHVEERFHRATQGLLEFTVTIDDPKMYARPWIALNKFPMIKLPDNFDVTEMMCSVSEYMQYNKSMGFGNPTVFNGGK
jgi:hypothetical protein